ncbi:response regulator [Vibrio ulleungensis]|uniref:histidine kinase n=1 Tax=Vibrio ulleungensis TaxID=2807619 RepID=A0ABS2HNM7_9VIBR|nr:response regulator [Vibrio ulleungensis]MBM7037808.1 response regulator [Vibrio ulleungensis]
MKQIRAYFLVSFIIIGAIPMLILSGLNIVSTYYNSEHNATQLLMLQAKEKAQNIESLLDNKRNQLSEFSRYGPLLDVLESSLYLPENETANDITFSHLAPRIDSFVIEKDVHDILIINRNGDIVYSAQDDNVMGENIDDPLFKGSSLKRSVQNALQLLDPEVTPFELYTPTGEYSSFVIVPVISNTTRLGVVALRLSHQGIEEVVQRFYGFASGEVELARRIDRKQAISVAELPGADLNAFEYTFDLTTEQSLMNKALSGTSNIGTGIDYRGNKVYAAWRYIPSMDLGIVAKADVEEAQADTFSLLKMASSILILFIVVIIGVGRFLGNQISRPIQALSNGAKKVEQGDYGHRVSVVADNELKTLANSFNSMMEWMEEATLQAQLHAQNQKLHLELADLSTQHSTTQSQSKVILKFFTRYLRCEIGAFYSCRQQNNQWQLYASIGTKSNTLQQYLEPGDGMVGEVILAQQPRIIQLGKNSQAPTLSTGTQSAQASEVLIFPVIYQGKTVHILEFAGTNGFSQDDIELLESFSERIALTILSTANNEGVAELLAETQAQSEELQVQQDELKEINDSLAKQGRDLHEQSKKLIAQKEEIELKAAQLEESGRYKSQFLANMSHELRTPLNSMLILSKSLADNEEGLLPDEDVEAASIIHQSGAHLLLLINDILDLSKIESGKMDVRISAFECHELKDRLFNHFNHMAEDKNLDYSVHISDTVAPVLVQDFQRVLQVATNLIGNAIKFTEEGSVKVELEQDGGQLFLSVEDTGCGIDATQLNSVFEAFTQADGSLDRRHSGSGLGLTISKQLATLLDGELTVQSRLNHGSRFVLSVPLGELSDCLPLSSEKMAVNTMAISSTSSYTTNDNVVVDTDQSLQSLLPIESEDSHSIEFLVLSEDEILASQLTRRCLEKGFNVSGVQTVNQALQWVSEQTVDAVIVDNMVPGRVDKNIAYSLKAASMNANLNVHLLSDETIEHQTDVLKQLGTHLVGATDSSITAATVLVVEDSLSGFAATKRLLKDLPLELRHVASAELAFEVIEQESMDLLLLDLGLPGMSGFEFLTAALEQNISLPQIMVYTGRDLSESELDILNKFTDKVIIKSGLSMQRLLEEVELFVDSYQHASRSMNKTEQPLALVPTTESHLGIHDLGDIAERLKDKQLLLVDDDVRNTFSLAKVLRTKGLIAHIASNGADALEQISTNPEIDLVLLDIMMPVMDGYEVLHQVRNVMKNNDIPIIALTASGMPDVREKCLQAGANNYVMKPIIDMDNFVELLAQYLHVGE